MLYACMAGGKLYGYSFAKSQFFPTAKEYIYLTIMVVVKH